MTTIKATCPSCGDVDLTPAQMRLVVCSHAEWSYYAFTCQHCNEEVQRPAREEVVQLLVSGGVTPRHWHVPAEVFEPHGGPVIDYDDVLDFVLRLGTTDNLAQAASPADHR